MLAVTSNNFTTLDKDILVLMTLRGMKPSLWCFLVTITTPKLQSCSQAISSMCPSPRTSAIHLNDTLSSRICNT